MKLAASLGVVCGTATTGLAWAISVVPVSTKGDAVGLACCAALTGVFWCALWATCWLDE